MPQTIVLAYSGGLDTSIIVPWLREHYDAEVVCVAGDVGQGDELDGLQAKALASGAKSCYVEDLREEFLTGFVWPTLRAGATYNRKYLLGTSCWPTGARARATTRCASSSPTPPSRPR
jgi:argininosuccinate synthase